MGEDDLKESGLREQRLDGCKWDGMVVRVDGRGWWSMEDG